MVQGRNAVPVSIVPISAGHGPGLLGGKGTEYRTGL